MMMAGGFTQADAPELVPSLSSRYKANTSLCGPFLHATHHPTHPPGNLLE